ncbi:DUF3800 domain-containing protein [candidate division KSB1 bacterium]|nr:DUF3800 domain-containing protein [candidate division KSB1 bacterium]
MHLLYIDDSHDEKIYVFSALALPVNQWRQAYQQVRDWRQSLQKTKGIDVHKELHAWKFISGRGRPSDRIITKKERAAIFREGILLVSKLPGARLFNVIFPKKEDERAFEELLHGINLALRAWGSYGMLICDQGKEKIYTMLARRMPSYNLIPLRFDAQASMGLSHRNIPIERIIEDPFFKDSRQSYFIQLVDFVAYALLRRERPIPSKSKYDAHLFFDQLAEILVREANSKDPESIIRP